MPVTMQETKSTDSLRFKEIHIACLGLGGIATHTQAQTTAGIACVVGLPGNGGTIVSVRARSQTAPTVTAGIIDINNNGTTIFTATKLLVALSTDSAPEQVEADFTAVGKKVFNGDEITVDITELGDVLPGALTKVAVGIVIRCDEAND